MKTGPSQVLGGRGQAKLRRPKAAAGPGLHPAENQEPQKGWSRRRPDWLDSRCG